MTIPFCVDLPLMLILSVVCQADDGTIIDMRTHADIPTQPLGLFSTPSQSSNTRTTTTTTSSNSFPNHDDNDDNNKDDNRIPYCDEIPYGSEPVPTCGDRKDMNEDTGLFPCGNGIQKEDWRDCNGDNPDNLNDPNRDNDDLERINDDLRDTFDDDDNNDNDNDNNDNDDPLGKLRDEIGDMVD